MKVTSLSLRLTQIGLVITLVFLAIAILAPVLQAICWLQSSTEFLDNPPQQPPSLQHWYGTTRLGYDVFSRTVFGSQAAWQVVVLATIVSLSVGVPLRMVSGYLEAMGASTWRVMTRYSFLNVVQSVPVLLTLSIADAILILGGLGFLGLGLPEEIPEWGHDLKQALGGLSTGTEWFDQSFGAKKRSRLRQTIQQHSIRWETFMALSRRLV